MKKNYSKNTAFSFLNIFYRSYAFLFVVFIISVSTYGQGTTCATASTITINGTCGSGNITDTTADLPALASCSTGTAFRREGWYKFTVTGGPLNLTITGNTTNRNLFLQLISEATACGTLSQIGCANSDTNGNTAQTETIIVTNLANGTYYIKVANVGNDRDMTLTSLCVLTTPLNDNCGGASTITSNTSCVNTTGSTLGATLDTGTGACTTGLENAAWYQFQAVSTTHVVTVDGIAGFDAVLNVISNCGSATIPTGGGCIDLTADNGIETRTLTGLTIGAFYKIQVHDYNGDLTANGFTICVTHVPLCSTPTAQPTVLVFGTTTATTIAGSFTAASPVPNKYLVVRSTSATAPSPAPANGTTYSAGDLIGGGTVVAAANSTSFIASSLTAGTQYYFYIYSYNDSSCSGGPVYNTTLPLAGTKPTLCATGTTVSSNTITTISANITWTGSGNYIVEYGLSGFTPGTGATAGAGGTIASSTATTPYPLSGLTAATAYQVYVRQVCPLGGYSANSVVHSFATACVTPTAQPTSLILTPTSTTIAGSFTAASPAPSKYLVVRSTSATAPSPAPANGTTYLVNDVFSGATVVSATNSTSFIASGLTALTQYYFYIYSYNDTTCSGGPLYLTSTPLTETATTLVASYCIPTGNLNCSTSNDNIANVTINTLNNSTNCTPTGYTNFPATGTQTTSLTRGNTYNLSVTTGVGNKKHGLAAWIDFNQNTIFEATEYFFFGNGVNANTINTISVPVPIGATLGNTRMRVRYSRQTNVTSTSSCTMGGNRGETEDYTITIIDPIPCVAPVSQPTALILNPTATTFAGSFTAPSPAPNNYLVYISTTNTAPTLINGTTYTIGATLGLGTIVDTDSNLTFTATGLLPLTTYYVFVLAYNSACSGGPVYNTTSPLTGSATTIAANYCTPSVSNNYEDDTYFSEVSFVGTLNDVTNYSTYSSSPRGYQDFTNLPNIARQAQGEGVNISIQILAYVSYVKAWVDWNKNGVFTDTGEEVYNTGIYGIFSTTFGFIIPPATPVGNYRIRLRLNDSTFFDNTFTPCGNLADWGETEDYLFTVVASCNSLISTVTDGRTCGTGTVPLVASSASVGVTQYRWYSTPIGSTLVGTSPTGTWTTPSISTTTTYYVTAYNGCESLVRTAITAEVSPIPTLSYSPTSPTVCGEDLTINLNATGDKEEVHLINEKFNSGLGTFTNTNILTSTSDLLTQWQNKTSTFEPNQAVWFPAISSGVNGNTCAYSTSDISGVTVNNQLASAAVNTTSFLNLTLSMRLFYSHYEVDGVNPNGDYITIDVFNGTSWVQITKYAEDVGIGTRFETVTFDLTAYINIPNLQIRIQYYAYWSDGVAVDDIKLYGYRPITTALSWTSSTPVAAFTDAACLFPYTPGNPALNVYVKPSLTQLELGSYSFTANATLANGCTTSQAITVTNNSKIWSGGTAGAETQWENAANWKPNGIPDANSCIIIPNTTYDPIISGTSYDAFGKNITVKNGGILTVNTDNNITITDEVQVKIGGFFDIKNSASLIQTNNSSINNGFIKMTRTSRPMRRWSYVYGGSPIVENAFSQIPSQFDLKYRWTSGTIDGAWVPLTGITSGEGYIARVRNIAPFSAGTGTIDFVYTGTPKNGIVDVTVDSYDASSLVAGNTVLLANPYPSAIDGKKFLEYNVAGKSNIELGGTLFFWTSVTLYSGGGPYDVADYGSWNLSGGVGSSPANDPLNLSLKPNGKIAAGQGFFAQAFADGQIHFDNIMRVPDFNSQFFKNSNTTQNNEKNRIWLNLYSNTTFRQMLVGYIDGATDGQDRLYDGDSFSNNEINIYSLLNDRKLVIQGKGLPFNENDIVPLGYKITNPGNYSIAIDELDGIFSGSQNIYLRDKLLTIDHDIKISPYSFSTTAGIFDNRFEIVYVTNALGTDNPTEINTFAMISNNTLKIKSGELIKEIKIFDMTGKLIKTYKPDTLQNSFEDNFPHANGVYLAIIKLDNDIVVKRKLLN